MEPASASYLFFSPKRRLTRFWSARLTPTSCLSSRFDRLLFLRRKWVARAFLLLSLPRPVILNLFAVVL